MGKHARAAALASHSRIVVVAAVWLSLCAYAGRPLLAGAAAAGMAPAAAWTSLFVISSLSLLPMLLRRGDRLTNWIGYTTLALFSTLLGLVLVGDVIRLVYFIARSSRWTNTLPILDPRAFSLVILAAAGAFSVVGFAQARCPRIRRVTIPIDNLPPELDGYRIVQWSDVHVSGTIQRRFVQSLVERTNELDADAVAITGDFVDGPLAQLRPHIEPLRDLRARDGIYAVTGNHEFYWDVEAWLSHIRSLGVRVLRNEHVTLGGILELAGVEDASFGEDVPQAVAGRDPALPLVLLAHHPRTIARATKAGVDLQLSGHTHGGQLLPWGWLARLWDPQLSGLGRFGTTWLYVSDGTGFWGPPMRVGTRCEIAAITLSR